MVRNKLFKANFDVLCYLIFKDGFKFLYFRLWGIDFLWWILFNIKFHWHNHLFNLIRCFILIRIILIRLLLWTFILIFFNLLRLDFWLGILGNLNRLILCNGTLISLLKLLRLFFSSISLSFLLFSLQFNNFCLTSNLCLDTLR
jgi:hypothetical protein